MKLPKKAATLLERVRDHILLEPRRLAPGAHPWPLPGPLGLSAGIPGWLIILDIPKVRWRAYTKLAKRKEPQTARFITPWQPPAEWALIQPGTTFADVAARKLDLGIEEAGRLFYTCNWPEQFQLPWHAPAEEAAQLTAARIDHFIATME